MTQRPDLDALWWQPESAIRLRSRRFDRGLTALCDQCVSLIAAVLDATEAPTAEWERQMVLATNLAFNSVRAGWELAFAGYYVQALALGRLGLDAVLLLNYTLKHKDDADLAKAIDRAGGELADDLFIGEPALDSKLRAMRNDFHQFAHQTATSVHLPIRPDAAGQAALHTGPMEDPTLFRDIGYRLLNVTTMAVAALIKWRGTEILAGLTSRCACRCKQSIGRRNAQLSSAGRLRHLRTPPRQHASQRRHPAATSTASSST